MLGYDSGEYTLKQTGPVIRVSTPDISEAAPLVIVEARAAETVEDLLAKDGRTLLTPYEADEKTTLHVGGAAAVGAVRRRRRARVRPGAGGPLAAASPSGPAGPRAATSPSTCSSSASATTPRAAARSTAPSPASAPSRSPRTRRAASGGTASSRTPSSTPSASPRTCARASACPSRSSPTRWSAAASAQGLDPLPQDQAQPLARQALRYLYRILFLLYAEASPELEVLPVGAEEYDQGYGLDRLRELTLVELASPRAMDGTHLYDSLARLFRAGRPGTRAAGRPRTASRTAWSSTACAPTCSCPQATALIDEIGLGNAALQRVLRHLLLSKEATGQGPRLHLLRRARHQPARRGVRGPDVLHRLLRRDRPVRGRQGRRRRRRAPGSSRSSGPTASPRRTSSASRTRSPASARRSCTSGARSSSGSPAGNASSRRRTTRPRC